jgi:DNA recombination protein RmuC
MIYVNVVLAVTVLIAVLAVLFKSRKMGGDVAGLSVRLEERDAKIIDLKTALAAKECELRDVNRELSDALGEVKALKNSLEAKNDELLKSKEEISRKLLELEEKLNDKFQVMASKILDEKTAKMNEEGSRSIRSILEPFGITLQEFKDSVNKYNTESIRSRGALA